MKRAFAIFIVVLLGLGMVGLVFPALMQQSAPAPSTQTTPPTGITINPSDTAPPADANAATTPAPSAPAAPYQFPQ